MDSDNIRKDKYSRAIVNLDTTGIHAYKLRRQKRIMMEERINNLEKKFDEIHKMLQKLVGNN